MPFLWTEIDYQRTEDSAFEFAKAMGNNALAGLFLARREVYKASGACVNLTPDCALIRYNRWLQPQR